MGNDARQAALEALGRCRRDGAWSAQAMDAAIKKYELNRRDAALASRLTLGVLQNGVFLDYYIDLFCRKAPEKGLRDILRLGACQLLLTDRIPAHAAVGETVRLCRDNGFARAAGLCNAVLRKLADARDSLPEIPGRGTAQFLATRYSHPLWLVERILREHDYGFAEAFLAKNNEPAPLTIQVNTLKVSAEEYCRALDRAEISYRAFPELPGCLELAGGSVTALPGFAEGLFYVQDRAARTAVEIAAPEKGMRVLDACAAPGGKSFAAAIRMENTGSILSCDVQEKKLKRIFEGAARLGIGMIETRTMDGRVFDPALENVFDLVLCDAPCSGLGVIGKRPEIRNKTEAEVANLPLIQAAILDNVCRYVKPGGVLLYSTCTVLQAENEEQIRAFLSRHGDFSAEDFRLGKMKSSGGSYAFWPQLDGTDGFFIAKLRKIQ